MLNFFQILIPLLLFFIEIKEEKEIAEIKKNEDVISSFLIRFYEVVACLIFLRRIR